MASRLGFAADRTAWRTGARRPRDPPPGAAIVAPTPCDASQPQQPLRRPRTEGRHPSSVLEFSIAPGSAGVTAAGDRGARGGAHREAGPVCGRRAAGHPHQRDAGGHRARLLDARDVRPVREPPRTWHPHRRRLPDDRRPPGDGRGGRAPRRTAGRPAADRPSGSRTTTPARSSSAGTASTEPACTPSTCPSASSQWVRGLSRRSRSLAEHGRPLTGAAQVSGRVASDWAAAPIGALDRSCGRSQPGEPGHRCFAWTCGRSRAAIWPHNDHNSEREPSVANDPSHSDHNSDRNREPPCCGVMPT